MRDLYAVLGVAKSADAAEIRSAYKKLARKHHPDVAKTEADAERFKEINAAYDVLGDEDKRKLYDEFGEVSLKPGFDAEKARAWQQAGGGFPGGGGFHWHAGNPDFSGGFGGFGGGPGGVDPEDLLGSIFGTRGRRGPRRGQDIEATVTVGLREVALGEAIELTLRRPTRGPGQGTLVMQEEKLKVRLPPAVEDGATIRLRGKGGESPAGGPPGDLLVTVHVQDSPTLRRVGDTLELEVPITFAEALAGGRITVPTFDGEVKVTIPRGVQSGQKLRLKGKGMRLAEGRGDLLLVLRPTPPARPPAEDADALARALAALYDEDVRAGLAL